MDKYPDLGCVLEFGATENASVFGPLPDPPEVIVIQFGPVNAL
jgi:hypothetical protein